MQHVTVFWWQTDTVISCLCLVLFEKSAETLYIRLCCCAQICNPCMKRALLQPIINSDKDQKLSQMYFGVPSGASSHDDVIESDPMSVSSKMREPSNVVMDASS